MNRSDAEALVNKVYAARQKGDVDALMKYIAADMKFDLLGSPEHTKVPLRTETVDSFRQALSMLVENFEFSNFEIRTLLVDGDNVAFHWRMNVRHPKTGKSRATEVIDLWTVKDGKVTSITQACDTALADWLMIP